MNDGILAEILSAIQIIERKDLLFKAGNFFQRSEAIDEIEFHIIERIDALPANLLAEDERMGLKQRAEILKLKLEGVDKLLFNILREKIKQASCRGKQFRQLIYPYVDLRPEFLPDPDEPHYDHLDLFFDGLLHVESLPAETKEREPEMVYYQKTPVRIILELIRRAAFTEQDVFVDLGSGMGHVPMLVHLLTDIPTLGIEFEPAFCTYARSRAYELNLTNVTFIQSDARDADYSKGSVFFLFTPFKGKILRNVLDHLEVQAKKRTLKIFTYGPCTQEVSTYKWLRNKTSLTDFGEFVSI